MFSCVWRYVFIVWPTNRSSWWVLRENCRAGSTSDRLAEFLNIPEWYPIYTCCMMYLLNWCQLMPSRTATSRRITSSECKPKVNTPLLKSVVANFVQMKLPQAEQKAEGSTPQMRDECHNGSQTFTYQMSSAFDILLGSCMLQILSICSLAGHHCLETGCSRCRRKNRHIHRQGELRARRAAAHEINWVSSVSCVLVTKFH